jgi:hypothetical protein
MTALPGVSISDAEKAGVRAAIFTHLAGLAVAPTVGALWERGGLDVLTGAAGALEFSDILARTRANPGYLRVALRLLTSCGWLTEQPGTPPSRSGYKLTTEGRIAMTLAPPLYGELTSFFLPKALILEDYVFGSSDAPLIPSLRELVQRAKDGWRIPLHEDPVTARVRHLVRGHLDGMLIGPAMVALARHGVFAALEDRPVDVRALGGNAASLACLFDLLTIPGWTVQTQHGVQLTGCGRYAAQIASSYGVTVSYLPMFGVLPTLLFGNPRMPRVDPSGFETMVNRGMNVWGSGGAHKTYFKKLDEIVVEIFNRSIEQQPHGICDMGSGDGTLLTHLYSVVRERTARGRVLEQHPLMIVGADFNKVARRATKQTLRAAGIPAHHVIDGDINRPAQLASDLEALGHDVHDLLHIRSFLDHNRPYTRLANYVSGTRTPHTTGAFAHLGAEIAADELEENLVRHLRRWAPYIGRFGLLVLELHTLPPPLAAANLDRTPAVAYDGTHGFSDQYLVELSVFLDAAREAGLQADERFQARFPPSELATVSLNYFTAAS